MKNRSYLLPFALLLLAACASLGVPTPQTFNEKESAAISSVTAIRNTANDLLQTGKISVGDAENVLAQTDTAREGIVLADTLHAANPQAGADRLSAIVVSLTALQTYLATRSH